MTDCACHRFLRERPSPFSASYAPPPWENQLPDVPAINRQVVEGILNLIRQKAREPATPLAGLLVGQTGSGKTHALGMLCRRAGAADAAFSFAAIQPLLDPDRPLRHLLSETVANLQQPLPPDRRHTQLDCIAAGLIRRFALDRQQFHPESERRRVLERAQLLESSPSLWQGAVRQPGWPRGREGLERWLVLNHPRIWATCVKVFFQYAEPHKRASVLSWLQGDFLDEEEQRLLGIRQDPGEETVGGSEDRAARTLQTLGCLIGYDRPLVLCFDQLENLDRPPARLLAFQQLVLHLFNFVPGMMVLCCVRGDWWRTHSTRTLDAPVAQRLGSNTFELEGIGTAAGLDLVRARLATQPLPEAHDPLFPFDRSPWRERLQQALAKGTLSPRLVLQKANQLWREVLFAQAADEPATVEEPLRLQTEWFEERRRKVRAELNRYPPSQGALTEALSLVLRVPEAQEDAATRAGDRPEEPAPGPVAQVERDGTATRVGFLVSTDRHHLAVGNTLEAGLRWLESGRVDAVVFLRDHRLPLPEPPKWPKTNELKRRFLEAGGICVTADADDLARWYALVHLRQAVVSGDLTVAVSGGSRRPVKLDEFDGFVSKFSTGDVLTRVKDSVKPRRRRPGGPSPSRTAAGSGRRKASEQKEDKDEPAAATAPGARGRRRKVDPAPASGPATVLFACVHNAGRSQMAAALFNVMAVPELAVAVSAGTRPALRVHPVVVEAMREVSVELGEATPRLLTPELAAKATLLVTMGCGESCPVVPGVAREDWPCADPQRQPLSRVRVLREELRERVRALLVARGWMAGAAA